jgi:prepilin-type N-terminal cleavage/methylation domain-containing protein
MMTSSQSVTHKKCKQSGFTAKQSGFTLIELLVVIAIIAILAAIIFPVFSSVQENARRSKTMTNMMRIYQATAAYELDNRRYPEFLFGPALSKDGNLVTPATAVADIATPNEVAGLLRSSKRLPAGDPLVVASRIAKFHYRNSLFPEYINDIDVFSSQGNLEATTANSKFTANVTRPCTGDDNERDAEFNGSTPPASAFCKSAVAPFDIAPGSAPVTLSYYKFDAFDSSPLINPDYTINKTVYKPRYSRVWTPVLDSAGLTAAQSSGTYPSGTNETQYKRQMLFKNPGGETVLTMTTHHVPKSKALVLFLNGSVKVWDVRQVMTPGATPAEKPTVVLSPNGN